eukprot:6699459-Prymnesium_polylepis.1
MCSAQVTSWRPTISNGLLGRSRFCSSLHQLSSLRSSTSRASIRWGGATTRKTSRSSGAADGAPKMAHRGADAPS